jgi:hypothetical protein
MANTRQHSSESSSPANMASEADATLSSSLRSNRGYLKVRACVRKWVRAHRRVVCVRVYCMHLYAPL